MNYYLKLTIITFLVTLILFYLATAFITLSFDIRNWSEINRMATLVLPIGVTLCVVLIVKLIDDY